MRGNSEPELTVSEAGRMGGMSTANRYGREHYSAIGHLGQLVFATKFTTEDRRRWGRLGGRPKRLHYSGENGKLRQRRQGEPARSYSILPHKDYNTEETEEPLARGDWVTVKK
jgi:hypothetical protein